MRYSNTYSGKENIDNLLGLGRTVSKKNANENIFINLVFESGSIEGIYHRDPYSIETISDDEEIPINEDANLENHLAALIYVSEGFHEDLTNERIKQINYIIMKDYFGNAGKYRNSGHSFMKSKGKFIVGNPLPEFVPELMSSWVEKANNAKGIRDIMNLHYEFEVIHPFDDGNGRTGRMLLNWMTLKDSGRYAIIEDRNKKGYFERINQYREIFLDKNPHIIFTNYDMLSKDVKRRLRAEHKEHITMLNYLKST